MRELVGVFGVEGFEMRMAEAIAPDEMNHQNHKQGAAHEHGDGELQTDLKIAKIGNFADNLGTESADELRREHVDADGSGVSAAGHHIVNDGGDRTVIPGHEKSGDEKTGEDEIFFVGLNGEKQERRGEEKGESDRENAAVGEIALEPVGNPATGEDAQDESA